MFNKILKYTFGAAAGVLILDHWGGTGKLAKSGASSFATIFKSISGQAG